MSDGLNSKQLSGRTNSPSSWKNSPDSSRFLNIPQDLCPFDIERSFWIHLFYALIRINEVLWDLRRSIASASEYFCCMTYLKSIWLVLKLDVIYGAECIASNSFYYQGHCIYSWLIILIVIITGWPIDWNLSFPWRDVHIMCPGFKEMFNFLLTNIKKIGHISHAALLLLLVTIRTNARPCNQQKKWIRAFLLYCRIDRCSWLYFTVLMFIIMSLEC